MIQMIKKRNHLIRVAFKAFVCKNAAHSAVFSLSGMLGPLRRTSGLKAIGALSANRVLKHTKRSTLSSKPHIPQAKLRPTAQRSQ